MDRQELYKYLETLYVENFKEVEVSYAAGFLRSIKNRLLKAKDVYNSIKRFIKQNWTSVQYTDKEIILIGIYDETLIGIYIKITFSYTAKHFEAEQVIVAQRSVRKIL